jgi:hypothetical protein
MRSQLTFVTRGFAPDDGRTAGDRFRARPTVASAIEAFTVMAVLAFFTVIGGILAVEALDALSARGDAAGATRVTRTA